MNGPSARPAAPGDLGDLLMLYRMLAGEMMDLRPDWQSTGGLPEPVEDELAAQLDDTIMGLFDEVPVAFLMAKAEGRTCHVRYLYTRPEARGVGVGEAMVALLRTTAEDVTSFDVPVLPGHRAAKNFLEGEGFKARLIIMRNDV